MRSAVPLLLLLAAAAASADPMAAREPFANAHVSMMARVQAKEGGEPLLIELEIWAEGTRLRAAIKGDSHEVYWVDGLTSEALHLVDGKPVEAKKRSLEHALTLALSPSPSLANANTDRIAGHPCKIVSERAEGLTISRCIWRGLPLSVEVTGRKGFGFNAAATLVEEGTVQVADLQPPPGAPAAPKSLSATR